MNSNIKKDFFSLFVFLFFIFPTNLYYSFDLYQKYQLNDNLLVSIVAVIVTLFFLIITLYGLIKNYFIFCHKEDFNYVGKIDKKETIKNFPFVENCLFYTTEDGEKKTIIIKSFVLDLYQNDFFNIKKEDLIYIAKNKYIMILKNEEKFEDFKNNEKIKLVNFKNLFKSIFKDIKIIKPFKKSFI